MAQPKRKSPDRKAPAKTAARTPARRKPPSASVRFLRSTVAAISRYPRLIGGAATFGVVFSVVAANALWYQPKHHPAPLLATRMFETGSPKRAVNAIEPASEPASDPGVTTFRIEREDETVLEHVPVDAGRPVASPLVRDVQLGLAGRGLYVGPSDGLPGPKTTAAILFFQESEGLEQTGEASVDLLSRLKTHDTNVAVIPDERPTPEMTASTTQVKASSDDIADLIRAADDRPAKAKKDIKPPLPIPDTAGVSPETIMKIQRALTRFAYANIKVDGVAGEATRTAIRAFEKNYNMPVTGEPSESVVRKLKSIGAI